LQPVRLNLPLCGARTTVRALRSSDVEAFHRYRADPLVALYQSWLPMTEQEVFDFLGEMSAVVGPIPGKWVQLGITPMQTDTLAGDIGLLLDQNGEAAEIGFSLGRQYQGLGLATEAVDLIVKALFASTAVRKVRGITDARNIASIRLLGRTEFIMVSEQPNTIRGEPCTEYIFERSRREA
jgi:RimJ/RimL family protein N-acetyltransferase